MVPVQEDTFHRGVGSVDSCRDLAMAQSPMLGTGSGGSMYSARLEPVRGRGRLSLRRALRCRMCPCVIVGSRVRGKYHSGSARRTGSKYSVETKLAAMVGGYTSMYS